MRLKFSGRLVDLVQSPRRVESNDMPAAAKFEVIQRDGGQCRLCQHTKRLHVHHIDGRGARSDQPNHDSANLITLCARCHRLIHTERINVTPEFLAAVDERRETVTHNLPRKQRYSDYQIWPETYALINEPDYDGEPIHGGWWQADP